MAGGVTRSTPRVLGYAQVTTNQTGFAASITDVTGLSVTFTAGSRPVWVEFRCAALGQVSSTGQPFFYITDASNNEITRSVAASTAAGATTPLPPAKRRLTILTPGTSYTFKVRGQTTAGTVDLKAGLDAIPCVNGPAYLVVYEE